MTENIINKSEFILDYVKDYFFKEAKSTKIALNDLDLEVQLPREASRRILSPGAKASRKLMFEDFLKYCFVFDINPSELLKEAHFKYNLSKVKK